MKKKFLFSTLLILVLSLCFFGCKDKKYDGEAVNFTAGVAHIQSLHREMMYSQVSKEYEWRNSQVFFNDTIQNGTLDNLYVVDVTDVFYFWNRGPKTQYITSNIKEGTLIPDPIPDIWIEDEDLGKSEIKLNAEDVINRLKEWDGIIPKSIGLILRKPVGPYDCNAQWVLGSIGDPIFIDAVTGDINKINPAFIPKE